MLQGFLLLLLLLLPLELSGRSPTNKQLYSSRHGDLESQSQGGICEHGGLHELGRGVHGDASSELLPAGVAAAVDPHGCLRVDLHPSVVVSD